PRLASRHVEDHCQDSEDEGDHEPEDDGDEHGESDLHHYEVGQPDEAAREAADDVLVALGGDSRGREEHADERECQRERVGLELRGKEPGAARLSVDLELDWVRRRAKRLVGGAESELGLAYEVGELPRPVGHLGVLRRLLDLGEHLARTLETDDVELVPEEGARAALDDQAHVLEVRIDVGVLQPLIQLVDERLGLLLDARRDPSARRLQEELRALDHPAEARGESPRDDDLRVHLAVGELAVGLVLIHRDELRILVHLVEDSRHVEGLAADGELLGEAVEIDEGNRGPVARVPDDCTDERREDERIDDQRGDEDGRAAENPQVLLQEEADAPHANTSASGDALNCSRLPSKTSSPPTSTATRVAKRSSSSRFCVAKT